MRLVQIAAQLEGSISRLSANNIRGSDVNSLARSRAKAPSGLSHSLRSWCHSS